MPRQIPHTIKMRAVELYLGEMSSEDVAAELGVSPTSVVKWVRNAGGTVRPTKGADDAWVNGSPNRLTNGAWVRDGLTQRWVAA